MITKAITKLSYNTVNVFLPEVDTRYNDKEDDKTDSNRNE